MLKVLEREPREDDEYFKAICKRIMECDGFVLVCAKDGVYKRSNFGLTEIELVYALEWAKSRILNDD